MRLTPEILTGREETHVAELEGTPFRLHRGVLGPFRSLQAEAERAGFTLELASAFRSFDGQLRIWNEKADGKRPLLDASGNPLDVTRLDPDETVEAILRWSALPGASRHHWGTDFDLIAGDRVPEGYRVQLTPREAAEGGIFREFALWLDETLPFEGFYRPYAEDRGGVSPEWWHLSYAPLAEDFLSALTPGLLRETLEKADIRLKDTVLGALDDIHARYVTNVCPYQP